MGVTVGTARMAISMLFRTMRLIQIKIAEHCMHIPLKYLITAGGKIVCLRCTAISNRSKLQCAKPARIASRTQKCQFHGGRDSGPKTAQGRARIGPAHRVHGEETNERRAERSQASLWLAQLEDAMHVLGMTTASRTRGRKPSGYWPIKALDDVRRWVVEDGLHLVQAVKDSG